MCKNKVFLEGSIVESYLVEEIATFNSFYFDNDKLTRIVRQTQFVKAALEVEQVIYQCFLAPEDP